MDWGLDTILKNTFCTTNFCFTFIAISKLLIHDIFFFLLLFHLFADMPSFKEILCHAIFELKMFLGLLLDFYKKGGSFPLRINITTNYSFVAWNSNRTMNCKWDLQYIGIHSLLFWKHLINGNFADDMTFLLLLILGNCGLWSNTKLPCTKGIVIWNLHTQQLQSLFYVHSPIYVQLRFG